jgi:hypothetical protein
VVIDRSERPTDPRERQHMAILTDHHKKHSPPEGEDTFVVSPGHTCPDSGVYRAYRHGSPVETGRGVLQASMKRSRRMPGIAGGGVWLQVKDTQPNDPTSIRKKGRPEAESVEQAALRDIPVDESPFGESPSGGGPSGRAEVDEPILPRARRAFRDAVARALHIATLRKR